MNEIQPSISCNSVFNDDKRRLLKAFHAFKSDPSDYNANRIVKAAKSAEDVVYVENAVSSFKQSIFGRTRYSEFLDSFEEL